MHRKPIIGRLRKLVRENKFILDVIDQPKWIDDKVTATN